MKKLKSAIIIFKFYYLVLVNKERARDYILSLNRDEYFTLLTSPFVCWILSGLLFILSGASTWAGILSGAFGVATFLNMFYILRFLNKAEQIYFDRLEEEKKKLQEELDKENRRKFIIDLAKAYANLGISATLDRNIVKKAYRSKAKEAHPDRGGSEQQFLVVKDSYDFVNKFLDVQQN